MDTTDGKDCVSRISLIDNADIAVIFGGTKEGYVRLANAIESAICSLL